MKNSAGLVLLAAVLAVGACGGGGDEQRGGVTADEARQLDEAANMIDASPDSLVADETGLGNGEAGGNAADTGALPVSGEAATNAR
jgi:hypothetical protein